MKTQIKNYSFDASTGKISFTDYVTIKKDSILNIINVTDSRALYNPINRNLGGSVSGNVLTLDKDTTFMSDTDKLLIYYEKTDDYALENNQQLMITALNNIATALGSVGAGSTAMVSGRKEIDVLNTAVALGDAECKTIFITALTTNSAVIVIGDSGIIFTEATRTGATLYPGDKLTVSIANLSAVFINGNAGDGVSFSYLT